MIESRKIDSGENEFDIREILSLLRKHIKLILFSLILCGLFAYGFTTFFIHKEYRSDSTIYITPKLNESGTIDLSTMQINSKLVNNYMEILKGETILTKVADSLEVDNVDMIKNSLKVSNKPDTEIIVISAVTTDAVLSRDIVSATVDVFSKEMKDILNIENITVLNEAKVNEAPVSPSVVKNTLLGVFIGIALSVGYVLIRYLMDQRLKTREAAESYLGIPVLAVVPYAGE